MAVLRTFLLVLGLSSSLMAQFRPPTEAPGAVPSKAANPGGALAALALVPPIYRGDILKISADNGSPNPPAWYILAKKGEGEVFSITVAQGQITEEKPSLNLRALLGNPAPITLAKVAIDSNGAWGAAMAYSARKGRTLGNVSYALQQKGAEAAPVWVVWCYAEDGGYIGSLELLATTGTVISSE